MEQPLLLITAPTYSPNYSTQPTIISYHITTIEPKTHIRSDSKSHEPSSRELSRGVVVLVSKMILHNLFCVMLSLMVQMYKPQKHDILSTHILSIVSYIYGSSIVLKPRKKYGAKSNIYKWRKRWMMVVASILPQIDAISFCFGTWCSSRTQKLESFVESLGECQILLSFQW